MCVSTVDPAGVPHGRFVDLKTIRPDGFVFGSATRIPAAEADAFFAERSRDAQLASWVFDQSEPFGLDETLARRWAAVHQRFGEGTIPRPPHWGGYIVAPRRIEFFAFSVSRAHERVLYELSGSGWTVSELQP